MTRAHPQSMAFVAVRAGGHDYLIPTGAVSTVLETLRIHRIPLAAPAVAGFLIHRENLVPLLELPGVRADGARACIVVGGGPFIALTADEVIGVRELDAALISPADGPLVPGNTDNSPLAGFTVATAPFEGGNAWVIAVARLIERAWPSPHGMGALP